MKAKVRIEVKGGQFDEILDDLKATNNRDATKEASQKAWANHPEAKTVRVLRVYTEDPFRAEAEAKRARGSTHKFVEGRLGFCKVCGLEGYFHKV